ncbi:MAG: acyltransferase [Clostridia bacterium]|nr:acyltransferase [Clostridia bacterium]
MNTKRIGEIELFRFIFTIIIIILHAQYLMGTDIPFISGSLAVEFFFIVSGYLMMASITRLQDKTINNLANETVGFIWKKIYPIYPEILVSFIIGFVFKSIARSYSIVDSVKMFMGSFFEITLLQRTGIGEISVNSAIWYIHSMLLCMLILYPLIRKFPQMMQKVVMPVGALLLLGWLYQTYGNLLSPSVWTGFTFKGNIRAIAELSLGAVCYQFVDYLKSFNFNNGIKIALTVIKWCCWTGSITYMYFYFTDHRGDFGILFVIMLAVIISFSTQSIDAPIYQNKFVFWLGKISFPLYVAHIYFARNLGFILPASLNDAAKMSIYFACSITAALIVTLAANGIRKLTPVIKEKFQAMKKA